MQSITLFIFGGVSRMRAEAMTPEDEFLVAGIGSAASVAIVVVFRLGHVVGAVAEAGTTVLVVARYVAYLNLLLASRA